MGDKEHKKADRPASELLLTVYRECLHVSLSPALWRRRSGWRDLPRRLGRVFIQAGKVIKDNILYRGNRILGADEVTGKTWLMIASGNSYLTLQYLEEELENAVFVAVFKSSLKFGAFSRISFHDAWRAWRLIPWLWRNLWDDFGDMLLLRIDEFFKTVGYYEAALKVLDQGRPRCIIFANDHIPEMRALLWAAKRRDIPTVYLQHASVSEHFPPLRFDLNLLEGQDSLDKYRKCGPVEGEVRMIGMPKFDPYLKYRNFERTVSRIGICGNLLDDKWRLEEMAYLLREHFPDLALSFRAHPLDVRDFRLPSATRRSDARKENIFDFLKRQDLIIAGSTSTHLEAVLLNVYSLYHEFRAERRDYYGYIRNGLVEVAESPEAVVEKIEELRDDRPVVYHRARYYNALAGTPEEGKSRALAAASIKTMLATRRSYN